MVLSTQGRHDLSILGKVWFFDPGEKVFFDPGKGVIPFNLGEEGIFTLDLQDKC